MNVEEALRFASSKFREANLDTPLIDAEILLCYVLHCSRSQIYVSHNRILSSAEWRSYRLCIRERLRRVPVQYIMEQQSFRYLKLRVANGVFIPRPETELLADSVIEHVRDEKSPLVVDVGTGCGAIALSVACEVPQSQVFAVDICSEAVRVAEMNACDLGVDSRVTFVKSDLFENLPLEIKDRVDVVVSNPPYIVSKEIEALAPEIKNFEPPIALDGGEEGLCVIKKIILNSPEYLKAGGLLAMEVGSGQARDVAALIQSEDTFHSVKIKSDYGAIERIVTATVVKS